MRSSPIAIGLALGLLVGAAAPIRSQRAAEPDPEIQVLERLAEERYADGDLQRAADLYREIAARHSVPSETARALFTAAWLLDLSGSREQALETLTRSLELDPQQPFDASLYNRPFKLLYEQAMDAALRQRHRRSVERTQAALDAVGQQRLDRARSLLEEALELDPENPRALYQMTRLDLDAASATEALQELERVVSLTYTRDDDPSLASLRAQALTSIGDLYLREDRVEDAEQSFLEATRAQAGEAGAWQRLGGLYLMQGRFEDAAAALTKARTLRPGDRATLRDLASSLEGAGRADEAASVLAAHLQQHSADAAVWLQLARVERGRGRSSEAVRALEQAIAADPENSDGIAGEAVTLLAYIRLDQEDTAAAMSAANQAVGWNRADPEAWSVLGKAQAASGQLSSAIASLRRAAELDSDSVGRQLALARLLVDDGQLQEAEAVYLRVLTLDPSSDEASRELDEVRERVANERAIVAGNARPRKPIKPKRIGLEFAGIDYKDLQLRGALVKNVDKKSPAARAGLRKGDLILWIGDYSVLSDKDFYQYLKRNPPSDSLLIEYLRDGRIVDTRIELR